MTHRRRRKTDIEKVDESRKIGDVYSATNVAVSVGGLHARRRSKRYVQKIYEGGEIGNVDQI
jgi:hypothetical protein